MATGAARENSATGAVIEWAGTAAPDRVGSVLDVEDVAARVRAELDAAVRPRLTELHALGDEGGRLADALAGLLAGGKLLRPAFCYWGWRGAGEPPDPGVVRAAAALELFHVAALVHDDVMDAGETRRGRPTAHRRMGDWHRSQGMHGDAERFGTAAAILLGDLCLSWSDDLFAGSGLAPHRLRGARVTYSAMRTEVMVGQYRELVEQGRRGVSVPRALDVLRGKSARYTVEHPLVLGGALAGAGPELLAGYGRFGSAVGEAFQLRDDLLGVFGDPRVTGKPVGDDLRDGKPTVLVALARRHPVHGAQVDALLGDPGLDEAGLLELRRALVDSGAVDAVERRVVALLDEAAAVLAAMPVAPPAAEVLARLADAATRRSR